MADLVQGVFGFAGQTAGGVSGFIMDQFGNQVGKVALAAAVLFYIVNTKAVLDPIRKMIPGQSQLGANVANAIVFGLLLYVGMKVVFEPLMMGLAQRQEKLEKMANQ